MAQTRFKITGDMIEAVFDDPKLRRRYHDPKLARRVCEYWLGKPDATFKQIGAHFKKSERHARDCVVLTYTLYTIHKEGETDAG